MIILKTPIPFNQFSSSLSDSLKRQLSSSNSMSAVFPPSRECTQQIWNKIIITLAILGICIMIQKLCVGMPRMYINTPGWHTFNFITYSSVCVTWWCRWRSGRRCRWVWQRCTGFFALPACLWIFCSAIWPWKTTVHMIFINHCRVSFYFSLHLLIPRKLNSSLLLFSDFRARFLNQLLHFLHCSVQKPSFSQFGLIQGMAHVELF